MAGGLNVQVEPMPVQIELFSPGPPGARDARRPNHFLFVGRLNQQKDE